MKQYQSHKQVKAKPMNYHEAGELGLVRDYDKDRTDEAGYYVEYSDTYKSWSPRKEFEDGYTELHTEEPMLDFGEAIKSMKLGYKVAREGWNGKDMWITLGNGGKLESGKFWNKHTRAFAETRPDGVATVDDYIIMKTASGTICMGWVASQADILAEDWVVVPD